MKDRDRLIAYQYPPIGLEQAVLARVHSAERAAARRYFFGLGALSLVSIAGFVPAISYLISSLAQSGFYQYLTLVFDTSISVVYGRDLFLSLLDSLPVLSLALVLALIGTFLWSAAKAIHDARLAFSHLTINFRN